MNGGMCRIADPYRACANGHAPPLTAASTVYVYYVLVVYVVSFVSHVQLLSCIYRS